MALSFENRVNQLYMKLNDADDDIVEWLRKNCTETTTIKEVANSLYVAPNTVFRLAKKLGYNGFSEMRFAIVRERQSGAVWDWLSAADADLRDSIVRTMELVDENQVEQLVKKIIQSDKVVVCGIGLNQFFGQLLVRYLRYGGIKDTVFEFDHDIRMLTENDMAIFISNSGETTIVTDLAKTAKKTGATIVSITDVHYNSLQKLADINLYFYSGFFKNEIAPDYTGLAVLVRLIANVLWNMNNSAA